MEILTKPVTAEDEDKWAEILREERPNQQQRTPYAENLFYDLAEYFPNKDNSEVQ
jgi:hypothetical protein